MGGSGWTPTRLVGSYAKKPENVKFSGRVLFDGFVTYGFTFWIWGNVGNEPQQPQF